VLFKPFRVARLTAKKVMYVATRMRVTGGFLRAVRMIGARAIVGIIWPPMIKG
jgi:hypothetical protein